MIKRPHVLWEREEKWLLGPERGQEVGAELTMMMYQLLTTVSSNKVTAGEVGVCLRPMSKALCP